LVCFIRWTRLSHDAKVILLERLRGTGAGAAARSVNLLIMDALGPGGYDPPVCRFGLRMVHQPHQAAG
jgi:hypothetical protein